ncbi:MAG: hypothetical protein J5659_06825 [Clostridia bacterium]|nr:hypothetical protein [Clostridia bacterium]
MKASIKVTFAGIITAIVCVIMLASHIPNITLAVPAVAGVMLISVFAEAGIYWALLCYAASSVMSFFTADKTSWFLFFVFFGYYPILKTVFEKIAKSVFKWTAKGFTFNTAAVICYFSGSLITGVKITGWWLVLYFALGNIAFVLYDIALSRLAAVYYTRLHGKISSILNKGQ